MPPASPSQNFASPVQPTIEDDKSRLFNFDDNAIDRIFSNNLGVHEPVVPTQPSQPDSLPIPSSVNNQPQTPPAFSQSSPTSVDQTAGSLAPKPHTANIEANNLFAVDDSLIDRIFTDTLGVPEHISKNIVSKPMHESPATVQQQPQIPVQQQAPVQQQSQAPVQPQVPHNEEVVADRTFIPNDAIELGSEFFAQPTGSINVPPPTAPSNISKIDQSPPQSNVPRFFIW